MGRCRAQSAGNTRSLGLGRGERNLKETEGFVTEDGEGEKLGCCGGGQLLSFLTFSVSLRPPGHGGVSDSDMS